MWGCFFPVAYRTCFCQRMVQGDPRIQTARSQPSNGFRDLLRDLTLTQGPLTSVCSVSFPDLLVLWPDGSDFWRSLSCGCKIQVSSTGAVRVTLPSDHVLSWELIHRIPLFSFCNAFNIILKSDFTLNLTNKTSEQREKQRQTKGTDS